jgi:hypothetical protein
MRKRDSVAPQTLARTGYLGADVRFRARYAAVHLRIESNHILAVQLLQRPLVTLLWQAP